MNPSIDALLASLSARLAEETAKPNESLPLSPEKLRAKIASLSPSRPSSSSLLGA